MVCEAQMRWQSLGASHGHMDGQPAPPGLDRSTFLGLPNMTQGFDFGWDPVPSRSQSTHFRDFLAGRVRSLWLAGRDSRSRKPSSLLLKSWHVGASL